MGDVSFGWPSGDYMSASSLKKFNACELQYWFHYVEDADAPDIETPPLILGTAVHEAIENVLSTYGVPEMDQSNIREMLDDEYTKPDQGLPSWAQKRVNTCLDTASRFLESRSIGLRGVEKKISYDFDKVDGEPQRMFAICDAVTDEGIWDWKTGKVRVYDEQLQASVYAAAYEAAYGEPPESVQFVYLKDGKVRKQYPGDELYSKAADQIEGIRASHDSNDWEASPGDPCSWCSYEGMCSETPVGLGDVPWEVW